MRAVINKIISEPKHWNQLNWHSTGHCKEALSCGTTHCIGGWAQILGGGNPRDRHASDDGSAFLGLSSSQENWLFGTGRSWLSIYRFARSFIAGKTPDLIDEDVDITPEWTAKL